MNRKLNTLQGFSLALSATAPWYSVLVTAPLVAALVGSGAALAYLLAAIPATLVAHGMAANDARDPDKGTVYTWVRRRFTRTGWFAGFCLAATGIIATSGMAYVAADLLTHTAPVWLKIAIAAILTSIAAAIDLKSLKTMAVLQYVSAVAGAMAVAACVWLMSSGKLQIQPVEGSALDWFHAVLLAVFAYWGFDAIFALTEEAETGSPAKVTWATMSSLVVLFGIGATAYASVDPSPVTSNVFVQIAVITSAVMSLGSTLVPTARGVEAMADTGELPGWSGPITETTWATVAVGSLSIAWAMLMFISEGLFNDTIEALSIFVGIYFTVSSLIAAMHADNTRDKVLQWISVTLMTIVTGATAVQTFATDYGDTSWMGVGGVGLIAAALSAVGVCGAVLCTTTKAKAAA